MENKYPVNWEKIGVYIAITMAFLTLIAYIADMKKRIRALETKFDTNERIARLEAIMEGRRGIDN